MIRLLAPALCLCFPLAASAKVRVKELAEAFQKGSSAEKARLAMPLGRSQERKAADVLLQAFDAKNGEPRSTAAIIESLGWTGDERAVARLSEAWDHSRSLSRMGELPIHVQGYRWRILEALGRLGGEGAVSILSAALNDSDPRVVEEAVRGLGRLRVKDAVPALQQLAGASEGAGVKRAVFEALGEIGDKRAVSTLEQAQGGADRLAELQAAYALAKLGRREMYQTLESSLSTDPGERKAGLLAAYYLARLDRNKGFEHLDTIVRRPDDPDATMAADLLGRSENPRAVLVLADAAKAPEAPVRLAVTKALSRLGGPRAVSALKKLRQDQDAGVRSAAFAGLIELGESD